MAQATPISQIRQLQTPDGTVNVFPITIEEAIHDSDGVQLSTKLADIPDMIETETSPIMDALVDTTVEGNPINFTTKAKQDAESTVIRLDPIQDLHGYDHPWVGGAGKNLLPMTVENLKALNTEGSWRGNVYTIAGVTYTVNVDSGGNVININANTETSATAYKPFYLTDDTQQWPTGNYILSGCVNGANTTYRLRIDNVDDSTGQNNYNGYTAVSIDGTKNYQITIYVNNGISVSNIKFYPMIRLATESDATFEPYTNICPISGRTQVKVEGCGKNLLPLPESGTYGNVVVTVNNDGTVKFLGTAGSINTSVDFYRSTTTLPIGMQPGNEYILTLGNAINKFNVYTTDGTPWNNILTALGENSTFTIPINAVGMLCRVFIEEGSGYDVTLSPMIRPSTESDATFEPYKQSNDLTISFGQTVYGGTVDVEKGELVVDRASVDLGSLAWSSTATDTTGIRRMQSDVIPDIMPSSASTQITKIVSDMYPTVTGSNTYHRIIGIASSTERKFFIYDDRFNTSEKLTDFVNEISGHIAIYPLATPTVIPLTPAQVHLLKGINNISTDGDNITLIYKEIPFAYESELDDKADTDSLAPVETGTTVSQAYSTGQYMMCGGDLYKVTASIANGGTITPGTNVTKTTVAAELLAILSQLS